MIKSVKSQLAGRNMARSFYCIIDNLEPDFVKTEIIEERNSLNKRKNEKI